VPAPIVRLSSEVAWGLGVEAYYQFDWNRTNVDPTGSYWATSDLVGRAAQGLFFSNDRGSGCLTAGVPPGCVGSRFANIPQVADDAPDRQGQWGVALRYFWDRILTEFGIYYVRYHSKQPSVGNTGELIENPGPGPAFIPVPTAYFRDYADGIDLIGASFATEVLNASWFGEISYRPDDQTPIVAAGVVIGRAAATLPGTPVTAQGYVREKRLQAQTGLIAVLGPSTRLGVGRLVELLRMDSMSFTTEIAVNHYPDLSTQCFNPANPFDPRNVAGCIGYSGVGPSDRFIAPNDPANIPRSSVDETSWGYQILLQAPYTNPIGVPITLTPSVGWLHDFSGTSPNQTFIEGRKGITVGLEVDYLNTWGGRVTYANRFDAGNRNLAKDRDFVSISVSYAF
jgi:hypothetical protein